MFPITLIIGVICDYLEKRLSGNIKTSSFHAIYRRYEATVTSENQTDRKLDILQIDRETVSQQTD